MGIDFTNIMKNKTDYLSPDEVELMLQYYYDNGFIRDYMLFLTLYRTGRRITEIVGEKPYTRNVGLRPCDIHPDGLIEFDILKKNHVRSKDKRGKERNPDLVYRERLLKMPKRVLKPVDREYLELLNSFIQSNGIQKHERIFSITDRRARDIIYRAAKACDISRAEKKIHPHSLRHSFAIHLLKSHPNDAAVLRQVQELLDHSDIRITMEYAKFTQEDKRDMLERSFGVTDD